MQFTNQYKLNLIEATDTFSPAPLNENMEKVEAALKNQAASLGSLQSSVTQSVQTMQNQHTQDIATLTGAAVKIATGTYTGTGTQGADGRNTLSFGFTPGLVAVMGGNHICIFIQGQSQAMGLQCAKGSYHILQSVTWSGSSLSWYVEKIYSGTSEYSGSAYYQLNDKNTVYHYCAIG